MNPGDIIAFIGLIAVLIGSCWIIMQGFRRHWLWLIFAPITIIVFPFVNGRSSMRPAIVILAGVTSLVCGALISQGTDVSIVLAIVLIIFGFLWTKYPNSQQAHNARIVRKYGKLPTSYRKIFKLLKNSNLSNDINTFNEKYFANIITGQTVESVNKQDENYQLFVEMMQNRYKVNQDEILSCLIYLHEDNAYIQYTDSLDSTVVTDENTLLKEIVVKDILAGREPNYEFIQRWAEQQKIKIRSQKLEMLYPEIYQEMKLSQFEKSFSSKSIPTNIEEEIKQEKYLEQVNQNLDQPLDMDPQSYIIVGQDYSRDSRIDAYYRKHFSQALSKAFEGHCCKCDQGMKQLEFDHFWLPKSQGGNFLMRSQNGVYINNCIPLCRSCNASKGKKDFREFFEFHEVEKIVAVSQSLTAYINQNMSKFNDPDFPTRIH